LKEPTLKFPVTCPGCALQSRAEISIAVIANALLMDQDIRLYASCCDQYWTATFVEREQLRKSLRAMIVESRQQTPVAVASYSSNTLLKSGCR
jgi:hypothetical protein